MRIRILSLILCLMMGLSIMSGCGAKKEEATGDETATSAQEVTNNQDASKDDSGSAVTNSGEKKKVVIVKETEDDLRNQTVQKVKDALGKAGFASGNNLEITELDLGGDQKKCPETVDKIKQLKPDVAIIVQANFAVSSIGTALEDSGIPVVVYSGAEGFVDANSKPTKNITGVYTLPADIQFNAFTLLNKISPINGEKAVFITCPGIFKKEDVEANLKKLNIELKDYVECKYEEDFEAAVKKYNADSEVGWELVGVWQLAKKDGSSLSLDDAAKWDIANRTKPSVTYFDIAVQYGMLCGLGVDLPEMGAQAGEIAAKILNGEKVEDINAVAPRKVNIVLNKKRADNLKINIPSDILGSAANVYTTTILDKK